MSTVAGAHKMPDHQEELFKHSGLEPFSLLAWICMLTQKLTHANGLLGPLLCSTWQQPTRFHEIHPESFQDVMLRTLCSAYSLTRQEVYSSKMITSCVINFVIKLYKQRCVYFLAITVTCIHYVTGLTWPLNPESSSSSYLTFLSCLLIFKIRK